MLIELLEMNSVREVLLSEQVKVRGLLKAIEKRDFGKVQKLLDRGADVNVKDRDGMTPLSQAIYVDNFDLIKDLVDRGTDVNAKDRWGKSILMDVADRSEDPEIIKFLVSKGADIKYIDKNGKTVLHHALNLISPTPVDFIKALIDLGADPNVTARGYADTALYGATRHLKNLDVVKLLLKHTDKKLIDRAFLEMMDGKDRDSSIVKAFLDGGADVNGKGDGGKTPLMMAILEEVDVNVIKLLVKYGADKNIKDNYDKSAWQIAVEKGDKAILKVLVK